MANTGFSWDVGWTVIDAAITLTQGATITDQSAEIDCDGKAAIMISIDSDYSAHAKATAGLSITIKRDIDDTVYESDDGAALTFEMPFTQSDTERKSFALDVSKFQKIVLVQDWGNTTASSSVTTATAYKFATVPVAS